MEKLMRIRTFRRLFVILSIFISPVIIFYVSFYLLFVLSKDFIVDFFKESGWFYKEMAEALIMCWKR